MMYWVSIKERDKWQIQRLTSQYLVAVSAVSDTYDLSLSFFYNSCNLIANKRKCPLEVFKNDKGKTKIAGFF